jgi:hypothetical protein
MYHLLTGEAPIDARIRALEDALPPPRELRPEVPEHVSDGVMRGLRITANERPASVTEFLEMLIRPAPAGEGAAPAKPFAEPSADQGAARGPATPEDAGFALLPEAVGNEEARGDGFAFPEDSPPDAESPAEGFTALPDSAQQEEMVDDGFALLDNPSEEGEQAPDGFALLPEDAGQEEGFQFL